MGRSCSEYVLKTRVVFTEQRCDIFYHKGAAFGETLLVRVHELVMRVVWSKCVEMNFSHNSS